MKISLIITVLNEEKSIKEFLGSVIKQTRLPEELVIVDGGSTDATVSVISNFQFPPRLRSGRAISNFKLKFIRKRGNRSLGRNTAIKNSTGDIIAVSDAGCILDKSWLAKITSPFNDKNIDVVAGYYKGKAKNIFQKCLIPYVLVMPDRVDPENFLPASRSVAFKKTIWEKVHGFPEEYSHNEDYIFAKKLKEIRARMVFEKDAIVYWIPRKNISEAFVMFFRFAYGDMEAYIIRPKVVLLFVRYLLGILLLVFSPSFLTVGIILYIIWSVLKNYKYVKEWEAVFWLPVIQIVSDIAIMMAVISAFLKKLWDTQN